MRDSYTKVSSRAFGALNAGGRREEAEDHEGNSYKA